MEKEANFAMHEGGISPRTRMEARLNQEQGKKGTKKGKQAPLTSPIDLIRRKRKSLVCVLEQRGSVG